MLESNEPSITFPCFSDDVDTLSQEFRCGFLVTYRDFAKENGIFIRYDCLKKADCYAPLRLLKGSRQLFSTAHDAAQNYRRSQDVVRKMIAYNHDTYAASKKIINQNPWYQFSFCTRVYIYATEHSSENENIDKSTKNYLSGSKLGLWLLQCVLNAKKELGNTTIDLDSKEAYGKRIRKRKHSQILNVDLVDNNLSDEEEAEKKTKNNTEDLVTVSKNIVEYPNTDNHEMVETVTTTTEDGVNKKLNEDNIQQKNLQLRTRKAQQYNNIKDLTNFNTKTNDLLHYLHTGRYRTFELCYKDGNFSIEQNIQLLKNIEPMLAHYKNISDGFESAVTLITNTQNNSKSPHTTSNYRNAQPQLNHDAIDKFGFLSKSSRLPSQEKEDKHRSSEALDMNQNK